MKPDWKDAPEWANWLAMDADGDWVWHEKKPSVTGDGLWWCSSGRMKRGGTEKTIELPIEKRPE